MQTLKVLAVLLHYPDQALQDHADQLREALEQEHLLQRPELGAVRDFIEQLRVTDLLDAQAAYVDTFERGRSRSLYLFEHLHGESRDRGEAMVELRQVYRQAGLDIAVRELPDYLPLFLEFLSTRPWEQALTWLEETGHLLARLHARLAEDGSPYACLVSPLVRLAGSRPEGAGLRALVAAERPDDAAAALDRAWFEEPVTFGAQGGGCATASPRREHTPVLHGQDLIPR
jgi:nitrate reductase molybdenum cofactor assembly chaperone NarJ/NarW